MNTQRPIFDPDRMAAQEDAKLVPRTLTVSQLNALVKRVLNSAMPSIVHLIGEISNLSRHSSGHVYLTLKDDRSEVRAVMWRSTASQLKFDLEDGLEVVATGHVDIYEPRGQYQFYIRKLEPRGVGALELAFRQLCDRLANEGLFDPDRKKPIPRYPRRIAVVTSPTGAAIRDIIQTLHRRFPCTTIMLHPVRVQGEGAADEVAAAIRRLNQQNDALGGIDVMIVGRGGGALEDLWAFNEEIVARALYQSDIPVITGIGHEIDLTVADLVADLRAPTPTAAAELAVPVRDDLMETFATTASALRRNMRHRIDLARSRLDTVQRSEWFRDPLAVVHRTEQRLDEVSSRLQLSWSHRLTDVRHRLHRMKMALAAIQPATFLRQQRNRLINLAHQLRWAMAQHAQSAERRTQNALRSLLVNSPVRQIEASHERLQQNHRHLNQTVKRQIDLARQSIDMLDARLQATSYRRTLERGFTVTRAAQDRRIITHPDQVHPGQRTLTETAGGEFESTVTERDQTES